MGWLSSNNKRAFAEKLMKDIRAREEKEKIDVNDFCRRATITLNN